MQNISSGAIIDNKYKVEKLLGEGGMGVVWLCRDIVTDIPVVLKAIRAEFTHLQDYRDRILAEGRALARIDHPNVVRLNAVIANDSDVCLVMQFIEGEALDARIERNLQSGAAFSIPDALTLFRQIVSGVSAAHAEGIIHRDLKPANVLLRAKDGAVKVTDFGIAKEESDAQQGRGQTIGIIGSVRYMAPEQCTGKRDLDKRVDIYALGILLFELLTGKPPFDAEGSFDLMSKHVHEPLPSLTLRRPDVAPWLEAVVRRCCAKSRDDRFGSCEELLAALTPSEAAGRVFTVPGTPMLPPVASSTVIGSTDVAPNAATASMPMGVTAPGSAMTTPNNHAVAPKRGAAVAATIAFSVVLGLGISYGLGWIGPSREDTNAPTKQAVSLSIGVSKPVSVTKTSATTSVLEALQGAWKSSTGREYNAVLVGEVLEMRIHDVKPFAFQGYEQDEPRLLLRAVAGKNDRFVVEDRLRPNPPNANEYDPARARSTCLVPFSEIAGKPLEARFEGGKLHIDMVLITPDTHHYTFDGKRVTGCRDLLTASVSPIESVLSRP